MNISVFLLIGLLLSLLTAWRARLLSQILLCAFWLVILGWSLGVIHPFSLEPVAWSAQLKIDFSWHIDGLARLFALLISGIGVLIFIYGAAYAQGYPQKRAKLLSILQIFAISMLGIVLTDNTIVLFLAWELTTVTSYLLIQFDVSDKKANQAAFNGMFISVVGGLAMLAGFILLHEQTLSWSIQTALHSLQNTSALEPVFWLLLLGAVTKSAQFPFYFWLPGAMKAPTPVSAYLHSATMVNAGLYLLARFHPLLGSLPQWYPALAFFGMSTMLLAGVLSLFQRDLKVILAYTTLFALGSMVYLLASDQWLAAEAFAMFLLFHGLYKAAAFMWVGTIDKTYGTRDVLALRGLGRRWWSASIVAIVSFSAMAGLPPFYGFVVKGMLFDAKLSASSISYVLMALGLFGSMCISAVSIKCLFYWFVGTPQAEHQKTLRFGLLSAMVLVVVILALEFLEPLFVNILTQTANSIVWTASYYESANSWWSVALSLITVLGGIIIFALTQWCKLYALKWPCWLNPLIIFEQGLTTVLRFGAWFTEITQEQAIGKQLLMILVAFIIGLASAFYVSELPALHWPVTSWAVFVVSVLMIFVGVSLLLPPRFLINMVSLAVLGLLMSALFVLQGAPDVAMTQLLVEILTVIILVVALRKAEIKVISSSRTQKALHALVSILVGLPTTLILFAISSEPFNNAVSDYFIRNSLPEAYGRNVVNVILVDFRAFDTFGEVLVIFATALAVWLLIDRSHLLKAQKKGGE